MRHPLIKLPQGSSCREAGVIRRAHREFPILLPCYCKHGKRDFGDTLTVSLSYSERWIRKAFISTRTLSGVVWGSIPVLHTP